MLTNFLALMLSFLQNAFTSPLFIVPLGFITLCLVLTLFRKMGGR